MPYTILTYSALSTVHHCTSAVAMDIWMLCNEMAPYLLLGFLLAGIMHEFLPNGMLRKYLSGHGLKSVLWAALFGIPLPLCSCGVIPTAMALRREGASKGATVSFLIATPQTGVDSVIATLSLMGLPFAIIRPIAALFTSVLGGTLTNATVDNNAKNEIATNAMANVEDSKSKGFGRILSALRYAYVDMMHDIGRWLVIGLLIAGLITAIVPDDWFALFRDNSLMSILFVLLFSIPMYLCATGSIPIAVALMMKGLTPGAALVLLMAGPASNVASLLIIRKVLGRRTLWVYLLSIISGAIIFGLGIDYLLPREWFTEALKVTNSCCAHQISLFSQLCTWTLILMLLHALTPIHRLWNKQTCSEEACNLDSNECTITLSVEGMHCSHCVDSVQRTLLSVDGVSNADVSLEESTAIVKGNNLDAEVLCKVIDEIGFKANQV